MRQLFVVGLGLMLVLLAFSCQNAETIEFNRYYSSGVVVYQQHCQNCHGTKGEGLSALIPPLTDSIFLKTNHHRLPCFIKNGLKGAINVKGKQFDGQMPAVDLTPIEIAQVITYVNNSFGNKLGLTNADTVAADIEKCK